MPLDPWAKRTGAARFSYGPKTGVKRQRQGLMGRRFRTTYGWAGGGSVGARPGSPGGPPREASGPRGPGKWLASAADALEKLTPEQRSAVSDHLGITPEPLFVQGARGALEKTLNWAHTGNSKLTKDIVQEHLDKAGVQMKEPKTLQTGAKGGTFYVTSTGEKVYVGKGKG